MVPPSITSWLRRTYPKPTADPVRPSSLSLPTSILSSLTTLHTHRNGSTHATPGSPPSCLRDFAAIIKHVQSQLLQSDLSASMLSGTGLPELTNAKIPGPPVLVEAIAMTEIGGSAFSLQNVYQARREKADLAGLAQGQEEEGEEDGRGDEAGAEAGAVPRYPRGLSDGTTILQAIEYRRLPELELGETPLGSKVSSRLYIPCGSAADCQY